MRKYIGWFFGATFLTIGLGLFWDGTSTGDPMSTGASEAEPHPTFALQNLRGETVRLSDFDGQIRIVDFWATWCPPCKAEIPHFNAITRRFGDQGVVVLGVSLDQGGPDAVARFAENNKIAYDLLMANAEVLSTFGRIQSIPTTFVIDQNGRIFKKYVGYRPQEVFEADIRELLRREF